MRAFKFKSENLETIKVVAIEKNMTVEESAPREIYFSPKMTMKTNNGQTIVPMLTSTPFPRYAKIFFGFCCLKSPLKENFTGS